MAIFTRAEKRRQLALWNKALAKVSSGQEYTIGSRRLRVADLPVIRETVDGINSQPPVDDEQGGRGLPFFLQGIPGRGGRGGC